MISDTDKAYAAGIFDGEGSIGYGGQHDPEYLAFQRLFYEDMKQLNRRGLAA